VIDASILDTLFGDIAPLVFAALIGCVIAIAYMVLQPGPEGVRIASACISLSAIICLIARVVEDLASAFIVVGALALIRMRTAIGDTREFGFLLLSVAAGLGAGERRYAIVVAGTALICALALLLKSRPPPAARHRLSAVCPQSQLDAVRASIANAAPESRLRLQDLGEGSVRFRLDFDGSAQAGSDLLQELRKQMDLDGIRYELDSRRKP
jgi:hypothetical protein